MSAAFQERTTASESQPWWFDWSEERDEGSVELYDCSFVGMFSLRRSCLQSSGCRAHRIAPSYLVHSLIILLFSRGKDSRIQRVPQKRYMATYSVTRLLNSSNSSQRRLCASAMGQAHAVLTVVELPHDEARRTFLTYSFGRPKHSIAHDLQSTRTTRVVHLQW